MRYAERADETSLYSNLVLQSSIREVGGGGRKVEVEPVLKGLSSASLSLPQTLSERSRFR
jgi:hypothetical protein